MVVYFSSWSPSVLPGVISQTPTKRSQAVVCWLLLWVPFVPIQLWSGWRWSETMEILVLLGCVGIVVQGNNRRILEVVVTDIMVCDSLGWCCRGRCPHLWTCVRTWTKIERRSSPTNRCRPAEFLFQKLNQDFPIWIRKGYLARYRTKLCIGDLNFW